MRIFAGRSVLVWSIGAALVVGPGATVAATSAVPRRASAGLIAYLHQGPGGRELFVMRADGTHPRRLAGGNVRMFVWSHGGKKIAYLRGRPESSHADLYVTNVDGTGKRMILRHLGGTGSEAEVISWLAWSPNGTRIAFMSNRRARLEHDGFRRQLAWLDFDLYVVDADGTNLRNLTTTRPWDIRSQDWSPDGKRFVLFSWSTDVYVMDADGHNLRRVFAATPYFQVQTLAWTPDGRRILFSEWQDGYLEIPTRADISVMNADGSRRQVLTRNLRDSEETCSPDGRWVAVVRRVGTAPGVDQYDYRLSSQIYLVRMDGTRLHRLAGTGPIINRGAGQGRPTYAWSPDGRKIVYSAAPGPKIDQQELYVVNVDGTGKQRFTHNTSHDVAPSWQPPPRS